MDRANFPVRNSSTGFSTADFVVGIDEARAAMDLEAADLASAADAQIAASGNAATIAGQSDTGRKTATALQIANNAHAINTTGKFKGRMVYDTTNDLIYFALGSTDTAKWRPTSAADGTSDVTPA